MIVVGESCIFLLNGSSIQGLWCIVGALDR